MGIFQLNIPPYEKITYTFNKEDERCRWKREKLNKEVNKEGEPQWLKEAVQFEVDTVRDKGKIADGNFFFKFSLLCP